MNGSAGGPVPLIDPEHMARAMGEPTIAQMSGGCAECERLGHICRPCRAKRYHDRNRRTPSRVAIACILILAVLVVVLLGTIARG